MDPLSVVISALVAGASSALAGAAGAAITDAYAGLKSLLRRCLHAKGLDTVAVDEPQKDAQILKAELDGKLTAADIDDHILEAALELLQRADRKACVLANTLSRCIIRSDRSSVTETPSSKTLLESVDRPQRHHETLTVHEMLACPMTLALSGRREQTAQAGTRT